MAWRRSGRNRQGAAVERANTDPGSHATARATVIGAAIGAIAVIVVGVVGALIASAASARSERDQAQRERAQAQRNTRAAIDLAAMSARQARQQADLDDLRTVLDNTARHIALATRHADILGDRCYTAVHERVAVPGQPALTSSLAYQRWRREVRVAYVDSLKLRVDRERLRIRLRNDKILPLYVALEDALRKAREPCVAGRLKSNAPTLNSYRVNLARARTTRYFTVVAESAGTQLG